MGNRFSTKSLADRFWAKVKKTDGCWLWIGCRDSKGYGQMSGGSRGAPKVKAHRASWILCHGKIPESLCVRHKCDNPQCVRPDHLELGTLLDNNHDTVKRGRHVFQKQPEKHAQGEQVHGAKLTKELVIKIRKLRADGWTQTRLAADFGVSQAAIWSILAGKTWRSVGRGEVRASEELFG